MVANYRCSEIKDEAMNKVHTLIQSLKISTVQNLLDDFKDKCLEITDQSIKYYDDNAGHY